MNRPALTEQSNPATAEIDRMNALEIVTVINREDQKVAEAIEKVLPQIAKAVDLIVASLSTGGRMAYFGAVTSGRIAFLDAADCPPTFGIAREQIQAFIAGGDPSLKESLEGVEDSAELAEADLNTFDPRPGDIVVSLSASGNPLYGVRVLELARDRGAHTIGISSNPDARLKPFADIFINPLLGEEVISGSSRMKSATAQKMILNMLSTAAMVRLGKTYRNLMVDVEISNQKLHRRACNIISQITGADPQSAENYLRQSGNKVKTACVMSAKNCSLRQAEELLQKAGGRLRDIIG